MVHSFAKEVFKTPEFIAWAKDNVVLVELDFPRRTPMSDELKNKTTNYNKFLELEVILPFGLQNQRLKIAKPI